MWKFLKIHACKWCQNDRQDALNANSRPIGNFIYKFLAGNSKFTYRSNTTLQIWDIYIVMVHITAYRELKKIARPSRSVPISHFWFIFWEILKLVSYFTKNRTSYFSIIVHCAIPNMQHVWMINSTLSISSGLNAVKVGNAIIHDSMTL